MSDNRQPVSGRPEYKRQCGLSWRIHDPETDEPLSLGYDQIQFPRAQKGTVPYRLARDSDTGMFVPLDGPDAWFDYLLTATCGGRQLLYEQALLNRHGPPRPHLKSEHIAQLDTICANRSTSTNMAELVSNGAFSHQSPE